MLLSKPGMGYKSNVLFKALWDSGQGLSRVLGGLMGLACCCFCFVVGGGGVFPGTGPVCSGPSKYSSWLSQLTECSLGQSGTPAATAGIHPMLDDLDFVL